MISSQEGKVTDDQILHTRLLSKESVVIGPSISKMAVKVGAFQRVRTCICRINAQKLCVFIVTRIHT